MRKKAPNRKEWYSKSEQFWSKQEHTYNSMLQGYLAVSDPDIKESCQLIERLQKRGVMGNKRAADCGSGIGRVTVNCLSKYFDHTDLIDPIQGFLETAANDINEKKPGYSFETIRSGLQDWTPTEKYDCIWCQWSIMYLTDADVVSFLRRAKECLSENGLIIVKDNLCSSDLNAPDKDTIMDEDDNSYSRPFMKYRDLFRKSKLTCIESVKQEEYQSDLQPLYAFVLKK